jgi:hypothetical protein
MQKKKYKKELLDRIKFLYEIIKQVAEIKYKEYIYLIQEKQKEDKMKQEAIKIMKEEEEYMEKYNKLIKNNTKPLDKDLQESIKKAERIINI